MTRKRFIKLAMSQGMSRNRAVELAAYYNFANVPYESAYYRFMPTFIMQNNFIRLGKAFGKMGVSLSTTTLRLKELGKALQDALYQ